MINGLYHRKLNKKILYYCMKYMMYIRRKSLLVGNKLVKTYNI